MKYINTYNILYEVYIWIIKENSKIQDVYYQEMREFVQASTGADKVVVFDHNVRNLQMAKESRRKGVDNYKLDFQ